MAFHPQSQHRGTFASGSGPLVEPSLALYCPIEGGDYIIDETVRELGRQTGAEVVVLDAVQLAAGECGLFGKGACSCLVSLFFFETHVLCAFSAASALQLPENPLHFPSSPPSPQTSPNSLPLEEDDDYDGAPSFVPYSQFTFHVVAPTRSSRGRTLISARTKANMGMSKLKIFFDEIINISAPVEATSDVPPTRRRPRIIYIRDFPTLAASSASWYPALLASVRARRQGPLARSTSPVFNPTTIVFGITPSFVAPAPSPPPASNRSMGFMNMLMARAASMNGSDSSSTPRPNKSDYNEDEAGDKAREKRLRERLRKWEGGDISLQDDLPRLFTSSETEDASGPSGNPEVVFIGGGEGMPLMPSGPVPTLATRRAPQRGDAPDPERSSRFFRTTVIVPSVRSVILEKACRMNRRREINELTMRMGVASVGGSLDKMDSTPDDPLDNEDVSDDASSWKMWEEWGKSVEVWNNVREIADRVVGKAIACQSVVNLDNIPVEWSEVFEAWAGHRGMKDSRRLWVQQSTRRILKEEDENEEGDDIPKVDEVVERVRREAERGDLDQHEQRLMGCIVDAGMFSEIAFCAHNGIHLVPAASMSTTFNQVHLPARTIDAIRTIVSLPLLHPSAFQLGILKEHAMTGCLLFGPPGTGKTLVVRALAKEAGCRMLAVSPSDVMDMVSSHLSLSHRSSWSNIPITLLVRR